MNEEFISIVDNFTTNLNNFKKAYFDYLEARKNSDTDTTRKQKNAIDTFVDNIEDILDKLYNTQHNYRKDIRFNTHFLRQQNKQVLSKEENLKTNDDMMKGKNAQMESKEYIIKNANDEIDAYKNQTMKYIYLTILLGILIVIKYMFI